MSITEAIQPFIPELVRKLYRVPDNLADLREMTLAFQSYQLKNVHPNPLNRAGRKCFSQTDEDGITLEILRRINQLDDGTFAEFGVGNGVENNTLVLRALGWKGFWVGCEDLAFDIKVPRTTFSYYKRWVTLENILELANQAKEAVGGRDIDVISLDLDGNDIHFVKELLNGGYRPKLFIVEYNAKFPPPIRWQMEYDARHIWQGDDYFGASVTSFVDLFERFSYRLVCCNSHTGANAFFVAREQLEGFADVPTSVDTLYVAPRYQRYRSFGHKQSLRTIASLFR